ncbi:MerR family transcriptional regulator [Sorangium sp. So ce1036]|uniref:MerR family transcriptional regulator n=1 Tax=Sorangium sp. So ce1036 TaxID=3133328 RepID=UPI003F025C41
MTTRHHLPVAHEQSIGGPFASSTSSTSQASTSRADTAADLLDCTEGEDRLLQVGDIARATGKTVRAIHHYEEVGLLVPHARSKGRYRLYDQAALTRVRWIGKLHDLGLSLSQIQQIVSTWESAPSAPGAMSRIRDVYQQKLEEVRGQIAHLAALEHELVASLAYLDTCETCDPAELIAACTNCNLHDKSQAEPELVAGIRGGNGVCRQGSSHR